MGIHSCRSVCRPATQVFEPYHPNIQPPLSQRARSFGKQAAWLFARQARELHALLRRRLLIVVTCASDSRVLPSAA